MFILTDGQEISNINVHVVMYNLKKHSCLFDWNKLKMKEIEVFFLKFGLCALVIVFLGLLMVMACTTNKIPISWLLSRFFVSKTWPAKINSK